MPIYEYRCDKGHTFEVLQRMSDDSIEQCTICGVGVKRVFHPIAVHFKGSGFYNTDYGRQKGKGRAESESGSSSENNSSSEKDSSSQKKASSDKGSGSADKKPSKASASSSES